MKRLISLGIVALISGCVTTPVKRAQDIIGRNKICYTEDSDKRNAKLKYINECKGTTEPNEYRIKVVCDKKINYCIAYNSFYDP